MLTTIGNIKDVASKIIGTTESDFFLKTGIELLNNVGVELINVTSWQSLLKETEIVFDSEGCAMLPEDFCRGMLLLDSSNCEVSILPYVVNKRKETSDKKSACIVGNRLQGNSLKNTTAHLSYISSNWILLDDKVNPVNYISKLELDTNLEIAYCLIPSELVETLFISEANTHLGFAEQAQFYLARYNKLLAQYKADSQSVSGIRV